MADGNSPDTEVPGQPLVSVVMNCYNGERYLREAIESVYAQTYPNWEIIFWDNASSDGTAEIARSFDSRLKYFCAEFNTPLGPARNRALEKAGGDFIAFLDADDVYLPCALQALVELMSFRDYGLAYAGTIVIDEAGKITGRRKPRYRSGKVFNDLLKRYDISMCGVMIRRSVIEIERLGFDVNLSYCPDFNLFMKIAARYQIGIRHDFVVKYRRSPNSLSRRTLHLVSREVEQTLNELQMLYPDVVRSCGDGMAEARAKLSFYDAVAYISRGDFSMARSALRRVIGRRWEYLAIYLILFLPVPKEWLLRALHR